MVHIWRALIDNPKKTVDENFDAIATELLKVDMSARLLVLVSNWTKRFLYALLWPCPFQDQVEVRLVFNPSCALLRWSKASVFDVICL